MGLLMNTYTPVQRGTSHSAVVSQLRAPSPSCSETLGWLSEKHLSALPVDFTLGSAHGDTKGRLEDRRREKGLTISLLDSDPSLCPFGRPSSSSCVVGMVLSSGFCPPNFIPLSPSLGMVTASCRYRLCWKAQCGVVSAFLTGPLNGTGFCQK